ncbi:MAG TPA: RluA family pseudouridine synthase, partial [Erythrobacter sp.]|nr:RluA family pseudouridine synthase [Erythrobacter sp.]
MAEADIITGKLASGGRLDKALADATELSRERIKGLIAAGAVTIGKTLARSASAKVQGEERFAIALPPPEPLAAL